MTRDEELKLEEQVARGLNVEAILRNPEYKRALISIRGELMLQFERTKYKDDDDRREIWRKLQTLDWFEGELKHVMSGAEFAKKTLAQAIKEKAKKAFRRVR